MTVFWNVVRPTYKKYTRSAVTSTGNVLKWQKRRHSIAPKAAAAAAATTTTTIIADQSLVSLHSTTSIDATEWDESSCCVYPNVISNHQALTLVEILDKKFQRRRYEIGHWDSAIQNYKETELLEEDQGLEDILNTVRQLILANHGGDDTDLTSNKKHSGTWLPCHAIDLHKEGNLNPHVDSIRFSGNLVAGLSLLSSSIMRLKPASEKDGHATKETSRCDTMTSSKHHYVDLLLPPRSLYVLSGDSRFFSTHELLPSASCFGKELNKKAVVRSRRLSVIFRDAKVSS